MNADNYKFWGFVSYSHQDRRWGEWLHRAIESYRVPTRLIGVKGSHGVVPSKLFPVFRDRADLSTAGGLDVELAKALEASRCLVLVCSRASAASRWVNEEVLRFKQLGRESRILCLIVDGEPNATAAGRPEEECFPPALRFRLGADGQLSNQPAEPLAADLRDTADGRNNARLKIISGVLGVGFDELKRRDLQNRNRRLGVLTAISMSVTALTVVLAVQAILAQRAAENSRRQADGLIGFMLGDLSEKLKQVGRLDILDSTIDQIEKYLGRADVKSLDSIALAQRSSELANVEEVDFARGQLPQATAAADGAVAAARELRLSTPSDEADRLLARALEALAEPAVEGGSYEIAGSASEEGLQLARRLAEKNPSDLKVRVVLARLDDESASIDDQGPKRNSSSADDKWQACVNLLEPLTHSPNSGSNLVRAKLGCEIQRAIFLYNDERYDESAGVFTTLDHEAVDAQRLYPRDLELKHVLLVGFGNATTAFSRLGRVQQAQRSAAQATEFGRRLVLFDPDNFEWTRELASSLKAEVELYRTTSALPKAKEVSDESLQLYQRTLEHDPASVNVRAEMMVLRDLRARLYFGADGSGRKDALKELNSGLSLVHEDDEGQDILFDALLLRMRIWLYSLGDSSQNVADIQAMTTETADHLQRILGKEAGELDASRVRIAYLEKQFDEGDARYRKLVLAHHPSLPDLLEYRSTVCRSMTKKPRVCSETP